MVVCGCFIILSWNEPRLTLVWGERCAIMAPIDNNIFRNLPMIAYTIEIQK